MNYYYFSTLDLSVLLNESSHEFFSQSPALQTNPANVALLKTATANIRSQSCFTYGREGDRTFESCVLVHMCNRT